jgi:hypothetical protein
MPANPLIALDLLETNIAVDRQEIDIQVNVGIPAIAVDLEETPDIEINVGIPAIVLEVGNGVNQGPPGPSGALQMIFGETPSGTIDGVNTNYTSAYPYSPNTIAVFLNGLRLRRTNDYTETGSQSFRFVNSPLPGDSLSIDYLQP